MRVTIRSLVLLLATCALPFALVASHRAGTWGVEQLLTLFVFMPLSITLVLASLSYDIWTTASAARNGALIGVMVAIMWTGFLLWLPTIR